MRPAESDIPGVMMIDHLIAFKIGFQVIRRGIVVHKKEIRDTALFKGLLQSLQLRAAIAIEHKRNGKVKVCHEALFS